MVAMPSRFRYSLAARWLHWLIALAIVGAFAIALTIDDLPLSPHKIRLINYHKWVGLTVLWLVIVRIGWRLGHRPEELPASVPAWQRRVAGWTHRLMYLLILGVPVLGWFLSSARGFPLVYLGLVPLPDLMAKNKAAGDLLHSIHESLAWSLVILALIHAAAALKHHFVDRDDVLRRML